jgi:hypothetical protein
LMPAAFNQQDFGPLNRRWGASVPVRVLEFE